MEEVPDITKEHISACLEYARELSKSELVIILGISLARGETKRVFLSEECLKLQAATSPYLCCRRIQFELFPLY